MLLCDIYFSATYHTSQDYHTVYIPVSRRYSCNFIIQRDEKANLDDKIVPNSPR